MNERIQELKIQACKWASKNAPISEYENACDEKFAELIVKDCAKYVKNTNCFTYASQADLCAERMKQHFGVDQDSEEDSNETCPRCGEEWSGTSCGLPECGWVVGVEE